MKQFYLLILGLFISTLSFSAPVIEAVGNGNWQASPTWNLNRKPANGDTIVIPAGRTVIISRQQTLNNVYLEVHGTVKLTNFLSYLSLNAASKIQVAAGGKLETTIDFFQYVILGGQTIFYANTLNGPQLATGSSNGFASYNPLPVKFAGFTLSRKNATDVLVQWSTTEEINAHSYEIERSLDGSKWGTIAYVSAIGNSNTLNNYSFTDKNISSRVVYYRVKQVDVDSRFTYTDIKTIKTEQSAAPANINIASVQGKVLLQFPQQIKSKLIVRIVSLNGQVLEQQNTNEAVGQVVLQPRAHLKGNYIVTITNGQDVNVARQVIL